MRAPFRSITAAVLTLTSVVSWSAPVWALRSANKAEAKAGAEEIRVALVSDSVPGTAALSAAVPARGPVLPVPSAVRLAAGAEEARAMVVSPVLLQPQETKALSQRAGHAVSVAFSEGRVFTMPDMASAPDPKKIDQFINAWAKARAKRELEPVLPDEKKRASDDLSAAIALVNAALDTFEPGDLKRALAQETRYAFVLESALANLEETDFTEKVMGFRPKVHTNYGSAAPSLYEEGQLGADSHRSVAVIAGTYPYDVEGKPAPHPQTVYLSVAHLKRVAQLLKNKSKEDALLVQQLLGKNLQNLELSFLAEAKQLPFLALPPENIFVSEDAAKLQRELVRLWQQDLDAQRQAWAKKDANRVTETFVSVNMSKIFGPLSQIPESVAKAAELALESSAKGKEIKDVFVLRVGDYLLFDVSHNRGAGDEIIRDRIRYAITEGLLAGIGAGWRLLQPLEKIGPKDLDWHEAHWRYTERSSQPTLRQVIVGGSKKAADGILFDLYASPNITTQQAIEGTHGTFFYMENTDDPAKRLGFTLPGGETNKGLFEMLAVAKTSNHAIRAVFTGKGGRAPVDEPAAATFSLGGLQLAVYNSQAGWEAIGGITGPGTAPRIIDGQDRRLSLKPVTQAQAPTLTSAKLAGELAGYAPSIWWGSQMFNNGEFDQLSDPVQGPEFASTQLNEIRDEFARVLLGQGEAQPFLKTEEADARALAAYQKFMDRADKNAKELETGTLTTGVFKADIGSYLGHTGPLDVFMATTRAVLEEAKQNGLIVDYLVKHHPHTVDSVTEFRAGDDIELHVVHKRPIGDPEIHKLAWRAFWAAGWVAADVLNRKPYGLMQDLPNAKDLDAWVEAAMTPATRDLILKNLKTLSQRDPRAIDTAELLKVEQEWDKEYAAQQAGTRQKKVISSKAIGFTGNVKGSGIGSAEGDITPGAWSILAFDKASPGAFSVPFMRAAEAALAAGVYTNLLFEVEKVRPEYDKDNKEIPQQPIILDYANLEDRKLIQGMLGAVNEFQIKAIRTRDADGVVRLVAVNSTDRLYQVTAGVYAGKDDPVSVLAAKFASFVFQWMRKELFITEGDERGSHWAFVLPVPMDRSSPGTHSIPIAVGLNFTITQNGSVEGVEDVFDAPAFDPIRSKAAYYNWAFIRAVGNLAPRGDAASVEATYPLHLNLAKITASDSPYSLPPPVTTAGAEEKAVTAQKPVVVRGRDQAFADLSALMERFSRFTGLSFDPAAPSLTGTVVDLSASPGQAVAALYLPKGSVVLVQQDALVKAMQLTGRSPEGLGLVYVENQQDFAAKVNQAIGLFEGVETVRILSTRPGGQVQAAVNTAWGRGVTVQVEGGLTLQQLLQNAGAVWNDALKNFLGLVQDAESLIQYL